ncbi:class I SAM-dependent methyltransferase [Skermania sp. ID1734]|uniref:class I SAM-dependent methyltransferase n=1 Tax=Skermania sp. ID1734 TaxID=2597516 RepID=UPI00117F51C2|nr:methyltransferase domain-containing protein [Skermania sp. ID1734]TSD99940.1 class I SAM-dependent methyltransferase [Skermania sp. ID1734]
MALYDNTGDGYARARRPDPRIGQLIAQALDGMGSVANIGAGTGSYEPPGTVVAVEPSRVMIDQRPPGTAPAVRAVAENLPLATRSVDAALAVLTIHHWTDLERGLAELRRIARRRIVILTWDHTVTREFWLLRDYLPAAADTDARLAVAIDRLEGLLPGATVSAVPVPHDCVDGFGAAYWRRPEAYLDPNVRAGMSMLALTSKQDVAAGLDRLREDLNSGRWAKTYADLLALPSIDIGYRLVTLEARSPGRADDDDG